MDKSGVTESYLKYREQVLNYSNVDMNLELQNDEQVYIAIIDIPIESGIVYGHTKTIALLFGLNTHIYFASGDVVTGLEKNKDVMQAMQSLFVSSSQVLGKMHMVNKGTFYESKNVRVYLKTRKGLYFREIGSDCKEDIFLSMLIGNVIEAICKYV